MSDDGDEGGGPRVGRGRDAEPTAEELEDRLGVERRIRRLERDPGAVAESEYDVDVSDIDLSEVDDDLVSAFVRSVLLGNLALLAVSLGLMLAYFRGRLRLGAGLVVVGALAAVRIYQHYRALDLDDGDGDDGPDPEPDAHGDAPDLDGDGRDDDRDAPDLDGDGRDDDRTADGRDDGDRTADGSRKA